MNLGSLLNILAYELHFMKVTHVKTLEELERFSLSIPKDVLLSLQDKEEMPVVEEFDKHKFIIIRIPRKLSELDYTTIPFGIVVSKGSILTICLFESNFKVEHADDKNMALEILLQAAKKYISYLTEIDNLSSAIEKKLYRSQKNSEIAKLLRLQKSLVYFSTALEHNKILHEEISANKNLFSGSNGRSLIKQVRDENRQALSLALTYTDILTNLMDAFASMISNNLNVVMKVLTSITLLFAVPGLIASIYGMNVKLPFQSSEHGFFIVMSLSIIFSLVFIYMFWKNDMI
jgi:magnesium transporter